MTRVQLEHIIRASGAIANVEDVVVIGSQAILGEFPNAPAEFLVSNEADVFPRGHAERTDLIDATIGEASPFPIRARPEIVFRVGHESGFHGIILNVPFDAVRFPIVAHRVVVMVADGEESLGKEKKSRDESRLSRLDSLRHA
jgi:hypothetical protein